MKHTMALREGGIGGCSHRVPDWGSESSSRCSSGSEKGGDSSSRGEQARQRPAEGGDVSLGPLELLQSSESRKSCSIAGSLAESFCWKHASG
jgi:hypothetical protein